MCERPSGPPAACATHTSLLNVDTELKTPPGRPECQPRTAHPPGLADCALPVSGLRTDPSVTGMIFTITILTRVDKPHLDTTSSGATPAAHKRRFPKPPASRRPVCGRRPGREEAARKQVSVSVCPGLLPPPPQRGTCCFVN